MSQPRGIGQNGQKFYTNITNPVKIDMKFMVDSSNANGLGISSLKSNGYVKSVFMNTAAGAPAGSPSMGTSRSYGILGASAVTNTGSSVITGNLGIYPGTSITGFPPGSFTGQQHIADAAAATAKASAQVSYNDLSTRATTSTIATALDGQSLTAGVFDSAGGTFTLAQSGAGTLTLTGTASSIFVFKMATTLTTGAGGIPTITLAGGALASNVYWVVGSSATINSGFTGTFKGNIIANTSITDTLGGTVNGSLIALNGAVTLSAAAAINVQSLSSSPLGGNPNPLPGYLSIQFNNNFNKYIGIMESFMSPLSGSNIAVNATNLVVGSMYTISVVGTTTLAQWNALGLPAGLTPAVGQSFVALVTGSSGTGQVQSSNPSGVDTLEVIGVTDTEISNSNISVNGGAIINAHFLNSGVLTAPLDGTVVSLSAFFDGSSVTIDGL